MPCSRRVQGPDPGEDGGGHRAEPVQPGLRVGFLPDFAYPFALEQRHLTLVPDDRDAHDPAQQLGLVAECRVHGLRRDAGTARDLVDRRPAVAPLQEELAGGGNDPAPPVVRTPPATLGVVGTRLDIWSHRA